MSKIEVKVLRSESAKNLPMPAYATPDSSGMDLCANIEDQVNLAKGERRLIPTGISIALPKGFEAQIRPRSGLAAKNGITVLNTPGTIDADYRGEIMIIMINLSDQNFVITRGMRIAQMVICPVIQATMVETNSLDETHRGSGGFGSTGVK